MVENTLDIDDIICVLIGVAPNQHINKQKRAAEISLLNGSWLFGSWLSIYRYLSFAGFAVNVYYTVFLNCNKLSANAPNIVILFIHIISFTF